MEQSLSALHPHPGWGDTALQATDMVGKHCILELYECDPSRLDDESFLRTTITTAAKRAKGAVCTVCVIQASCTARARRAKRVVRAVRASHTIRETRAMRA